MQSSICYDIWVRNYSHCTNVTSSWSVVLSYSACKMPYAPNHARLRNSEFFFFRRSGLLHIVCAALKKSESPTTYVPTCCASLFHGTDLTWYLMSHRSAKICVVDIAWCGNQTRFPYVILLALMNLQEIRSEPCTVNLGFLLGQNLCKKIARIRWSRQEREYRKYTRNNIYSTLLNRQIKI
jgi:hypothetical protein